MKKINSIISLEKHFSFEELKVMSRLHRNILRERKGIWKQYHFSFDIKAVGKNIKRGKGIEQTFTIIIKIFI